MAVENQGHLETFVSFRVSRLSQLLAKGSDKLYGPRFGLTIRQWRVLATLGRFPELSVGAVAARTALDKSQVSRAASELLARGLIARETDGGDLRRARLRLSPAGNVLFREVLPIAKARQAALVAALTPADRRRLERILDILTARAEALLSGAVLPDANAPKRPARRRA
jgi:DNA-binding MarR family transcriptional regulator